MKLLGYFLVFFSNFIRKDQNSFQSRAKFFPRLWKNASRDIYLISSKLWNFSFLLGGKRILLPALCEFQGFFCLIFLGQLFPELWVVFLHEDTNQWSAIWLDQNKGILCRFPELFLCASISPVVFCLANSSCLEFWTPSSIYSIQGNFWYLSGFSSVR